MADSHDSIIVLFFFECDECFRLAMDFFVHAIIERCMQQHEYPELELVTFSLLLMEI